MGTRLRLTDRYRGRPRSLADSRGMVVMLFFGFTHCPDVCPTTLAKMARAVEVPGPDRARVRGLFVTVDPGRDTPEVPSKYVDQFHPSFLGLCGEPAATVVMASEVKFFHAAHPPDAQGDYAVEHGSAIYGRQWRRRLLMSQLHDVAAMAADIARLLRS